MSERPEALWTVDKVWKSTGVLHKRYLFRTREAARKFREARMHSPAYQYTAPRRAVWGAEA